MIDPVLKLEENQEIVFEGYLHKKIPSVGMESGAAKKADQQGWKKRYFVLIRVKNNKLRQQIRSQASLLYFPREPKKINYKPSSRRFKSNPRRSATIPTESLMPKGAKTGINGMVQTAKSKMTTVMGKGHKYVKRSGKINLVAGNQVFLERHNTLRLLTFEGTILLKVDKDKQKTEIVVVAGQWLQALRQCLALVSIAVREQDFENKMSFTFYSPAVARAQVDTRGQAELPTEMKQVLANSVLVDEFMDYLRTVRASENLKFYLASRKFMQDSEALYRRKPAAKNREFEIRQQARQVYEKYVNPDGRNPINLSYGCRQELVLKFKENKEDKHLGMKRGSKSPFGIYAPDLFLAAQNEIYLLMEANFFHGFYKDLSKRTGCFSHFVYRYELTGYDAVFTNHFGSVRTESERLIKRFEQRLDRIRLQIKNLNEQGKISQEIAMKDFVTLGNTLTKLYKLNQKKLERLCLLRDVLEKQVNFLKASQKNVQRSLVKIHTQDEAKLEKYQKNVQDKTLLKKFMGVCDRAHNDYRRQIITLEEFAATIRQPILNADNIEEVTAQVERKYQKKTAKLTREKDSLKAELTSSLDQLEKVDLRRITAQQEICQIILRAEYNFSQGCKEDLEMFIKDVGTLNASKDVQVFAGAILSAPNAHGNKEN